MRRPTKDLNGKCGLNAARALFQKSDVLLFSFANAPQGSAEADRGGSLWFFAGTLDPSVFECEFCGYDCKLRVTIEPLRTVRGEILFRVPIGNFSGATHGE